jgi:ferric-dicitrate binding protein FerR (iron transport regulator)
MDEAAGWFVRLSRTSISVEALCQFADWRQTSTNAEAYRAIESAWQAAAELGSDPDLLAEAASALGDAMATPEP